MSRRRISFIARINNAHARKERRWTVVAFIQQGVKASNFDELRNSFCFDCGQAHLKLPLFGFSVCAVG